MTGNLHRRYSIVRVMNICACAQVLPVFKRSPPTVVEPCRQCPPPKSRASPARCAPTRPSCTDTPMVTPRSWRARCHSMASTSWTTAKRPAAAASNAPPRPPVPTGSGSGPTYPAAASGPWEPPRPTPPTLRFPGRRSSVDTKGTGSLRL